MHERRARYQARNPLGVHRCEHLPHSARCSFAQKMHLLDTQLVEKVRDFAHDGRRVPHVAPLVLVLVLLAPWC